MVIQYVMALVFLFGGMWIVGHFVEINKSGWFEMWRSFTIPYIILAATYYLVLKKQTKKQNEMLGRIKKRPPE